MHEWPILIFTILFTTAAGLTGFVALSGTLLKGELDCARRYELLRNPMLAACGLAIVGLAASFAHIGYPLNSPHALRNVMSSALSREIVVTSAFVGATCLTTLVGLRTRCISLVAVAGCFLIGLCAVWFMGEVYRNTSVVTWMHANTHVMFFGGLLAMGAVLGLALIGATAARPAGVVAVRRLFAWTAALVLVGLAAQLAVLPSYVMAINTNPLNAVASIPSQSLEAFQSLAELRCLRWIASMVGAATLLYAAWRTMRSEVRAAFALSVVAGILLFGGEIVGRYVFYTIYG
jgi:anaerobic dimethyl sulfoxide reductase subunit C (anchor subunit)